MSKKIKIISAAISALMLLQSFSAISFAEDVNVFPPKRPQVGKMKVDICDSNGEDVFVGLRTNGTINVRARELDRFGDGISPGLKHKLLSLTNIVDVTCINNAVVALKSDGTLFVGQHMQEDCVYPMFSYLDEMQPFSEATSWTDIVEIGCGRKHLVGLKADGTVVATGENSKGQCDVLGWSNVAKLFVQDNMTIGIRNDGTLLATGEAPNFKAIRNVSGAVEVCQDLSGVLYSDGTTSMRAEVQLLNGEIADVPDVYYMDDDSLNPHPKELSIDEVFKLFGKNTTIKDIDTDGGGIGGLRYYILDSANDLYILEITIHGYASIELIESDIESFILSMNDYHAIDKNGQILSENSALTSSDWILTTNITYNGSKIDSDVPPYVKDGRTLAPIRAILEALGMTVTWDPQTMTATATKDGITITVTINSNIATVNGVPKTLDVPAEITNDRTFVPVRFFAEALNMNVNWDGATHTVVIQSK